MNIAVADVPSLLNYQGKLLDDSGKPVTGSVNLGFDFYRTETAGIPIVSIPPRNVQVTQGLFNVLLEVPGPLFDERETWLGLNVNGAEMTPRMQLEQLSGSPSAVPIILTLSHSPVGPQFNH